MNSLIGVSLVAIGTILYTIGFIVERIQYKREKKAIKGALRDAGYV